MISRFARALAVPVSQMSPAAGASAVPFARAADQRMTRAADSTREGVLDAGAAGLLINDVRYRGYPAGPPGRLVFEVDIPKGYFSTLALVKGR